MGWGRIVWGRVEWGWGWGWGWLGWIGLGSKGPILKTTKQLFFGQIGVGGVGGGAAGGLKGPPALHRS